VKVTGVLVSNTVVLVKSATLEAPRTTVRVPGANAKV
jgi:hypothetical protein